MVGEYSSLGRKLFVVFNYALWALLALLCLLPFVNVIAISLSSGAAVAAGIVKLWPVGWTTAAYDFVLQKKTFATAFGISIQRVVLGTLLNMLLTVLAAYPLSKETAAFKGRTIYVWYFVVTILFGGGLIPTYMVVKETGLIDSLWALILPGIVPVGSIILMLNFFRSLPRELEESAYMDGASPLRTLLAIYIPLSAPSIATLTLFSMVGHWNAWFDGLIYMNAPEKYPLQSYLQTVLINNAITAQTPEEVELMKVLTNRTIKSAQIVLAVIPILLVYPFLQKYFVKGIVLGSVKE